MLALAHSDAVIDEPAATFDRAGECAHGVALLFVVATFLTSDKARL